MKKYYVLTNFVTQIINEVEAENEEEGITAILEYLTEDLLGDESINIMESSSFIFDNKEDLMESDYYRNNYPYYNDLNRKKKNNEKIVIISKHWICVPIHQFTYYGANPQSPNKNESEVN